MSIKFRLPQPGEERFAWCNGIAITIAGPDGELRGTIDVEFRVLDLDEYAELLDEIQEGSADTSVREFLEENIREVRGLLDESGEPYDPDTQLDFACRSADVAPQVFRAYTDYIFRKAGKVQISGRSRERRSKKARRSS